MIIGYNSRDIGINVLEWGQFIVIHLSHSRQWFNKHNARCCIWYSKRQCLSIQQNSLGIRPCNTVAVDRFSPTNCENVIRWAVHQRTTCHALCISPATENGCSPDCRKHVSYERRRKNRTSRCVMQCRSAKSWRVSGVVSGDRTGSGPSFGARSCEQVKENWKNRFRSLADCLYLTFGVATQCTYPTTFLHKLRHVCH